MEWEVKELTNVYTVWIDSKTVIVKGQPAEIIKKVLLCDCNHHIKVYKDLSSIFEDKKKKTYYINNLEAFIYRLSLINIAPIEVIPDIYYIYNKVNIKDFGVLSRMSDKVKNVLDMMEVLERIFKDFGKLNISASNSVQKLLRKNDNKSERYNLWFVSKYYRLDDYTFDFVRKSFYGGISSLNKEYQNKELHNVYSYDMKSAYPAQIAKRDFPYYVKAGHTYKDKKAEAVFNDLSDCNRMWIATLYIGFILPKNTNFIIQPYNKQTMSAENVVLMKDKLFSAHDLTITLCNIDYKTMQKVYNMSNIKCLEIAELLPLPAEPSCGSYLPTTVYKTLDSLLYNKIHTDKEKDPYMYQYYKLLCNSIYGIFGKKRYSFYQQDCGTVLWGIYISAYQREYLVDCILNIGIENWVYSNTDSIKCLCPMKTNDFYSKKDKERLKDCPQLLEIGMWELEEVYDKFIIFGVCKYAGETNGVFKTSISGLYKDQTILNKWSDISIDPTHIYEHGLLRECKNSTGIVKVWLNFNLITENSSWHRGFNK